MADKKEPLTRSEMMARIRSTDTKPEMVVRRGLHAAGIRYRLHVRSLPGCPDLVLRKYGCAIFVHGCFWHGHRGCANFRLPKTRAEFWAAKIGANIERDQRAIRSLVNSGWRVLIIWECATRTIEAGDLAKSVSAWLGGRGTIAEMSSDGLVLDGGMILGIVAESREHRDG